MLSELQKKDLYQLIVILIGEDSTIKSYQQSFNSKTVDVVGCRAVIKSAWKSRILQSVV